MSVTSTRRNQNFLIQREQVPMASRRKLIPIFIALSYGMLAVVYLSDENNLQSDIQPYKGFPSLWKKYIQIPDMVHTQQNALYLQNEYYGTGCQENPYREGLQILLHTWNLIAERRNISKFFICFGSMLGSLRNGDIIPLDTDVDICMLRNDYHKLYTEESNKPLDLNDGKIHLLLQRHSPHPQPHTPRQDCNGRIVRTTTDDCSILDPHARLYIHTKIYLDIFMIEAHGDVLWDEYRNVFHKREVLFPLNSCSYLGITSKCPRDHLTYLTSYYGKNFMAPLTVCKNGRWVPNVEPNGTARIFLLVLITCLALVFLKCKSRLVKCLFIQ